MSFSFLSGALVSRSYRYILLGEEDIPILARTTLPVELQDALVAYFSHTHPHAKISNSASLPPNASNYLTTLAMIHPHTFIHGRRVVAKADPGRAPNSIVQTEIDGQTYAGQVTHIFTHKQDRLQRAPVLYLYVRWFRRFAHEIADIWDP